MIHRNLMLLLAALTLPIASAAGVTYDVGASGRCKDHAPLHPPLDPLGGEAALIVKSNDLSGVTGFNPVGAASAVAAFVLPPGDPSAGTGCSDPNSNDYVEVHVYLDTNQDGTWEVGEDVCYAGSAAAILTTSCYTP